eukprot:13083692-Ditylum_brightwellii.AAC.1
MHRVQQLKEGRGDCVVCNHSNGAVWDTNDIGLLKGVGKKTNEVLANILNFKTIGEFKEWCTPENAKHFLEGNKGISEKNLHSVFDAASAASPGSPLNTVDIDY